MAFLTIPHSNLKKQSFQLFDILKKILMETKVEARRMKAPVRFTTKVQITKSRNWSQEQVGEEWVLKVSYQVLS